MRRIQCIELHEQEWFPDSARNDVTDMLQFGISRLRAYAPAIPLLKRALNVAGSHLIVDLCSGGGGPWLDLCKEFQNENAVRVYLTDKYPNLAAFKDAETRLCNITFSSQPIDATNVPRELQGFRTMFTSFHHFPQMQARSILQSAVDARQGIGIFEITQRTPSAIFVIFLWAFTPFLFVPFIRPFRWSRLLWTYMIPLLPFVLLFDGIVSCLRSYRPQELDDFVAELNGSDYEWEVGEQGVTPLRITYLLGYPHP